MSIGADITEYYNDMYKEDNLGSIIKKARCKRGFTVKHLAEVLNVNRSSIQHWEHNRRIPSAYHALLLSNYLNIDLKVLCSATKKEKLQEELTKHNRYCFIM